MRGAQEGSFKKHRSLQDVGCVSDSDPSSFLQSLKPSYIGERLHSSTTKSQADGHAQEVAERESVYTLGELQIYNMFPSGEASM